MQDAPVFHLFVLLPPIKDDKSHRPTVELVGRRLGKGQVACVPTVSGEQKLDKILLSFNECSYFY